MKLTEEVRRWLSNPVLAEWNQAPSWCDLRSERDYATILQLSRILALRAMPTSMALLLLGLWLIGRIPGATGPLPWRTQLLFVLPFLALALPYVSLRLGLLKPEPGTSVRVRLRVRTLELVGRRGTLKTFPWSSFDAFDFGYWEEYDLLKLRLRERWPVAGRRPRTVAGFEIGTSGTLQSEIRQVLLERGLHEEPLGAPTA
jgi:hypothetical protein